MESAWPLVVGALWILSLFEAVAILGLARTVGLLQLQLGPMPGPLITDDSLKLGSPAPLVRGELAGNSGEIFTWEASEGIALLLFITPTCAMCRGVLRDAARMHAARDYRAEIIAISHGDPSQNRALAAPLGKLPLVSDTSGAIHSAYGVTRTPLVVLVSEGRVTSKGVANNRDQLEAMLEGRGHYAPDPLWLEADRLDTGKAAKA